MKGYSDTVLSVLAMAKTQNGNIYPDDLKQLRRFKTSPRDTREGYLGKLVKIELIEPPKDKSASSLYKLTTRGDWVVRMYGGGWVYSESYWTNGEIILDKQTENECEKIGTVPIFIKKVEDLQES